LDATAFRFQDALELPHVLLRRVPQYESKGAMMSADEPAHDTSLTVEEQAVLVRFFRRALNLDDVGAVTPESVLDYLRVVTDAIDPEEPGSIAELRSTLEDAWRPSDG